MKTKAGIEKPLAEWTLREVVDFCEHNRPCPNDNCQLSGVCGVTDVSVWDLSEKPKFTEQEIQDAKAIIRISGEKDGYIERSSDGELHFTVRSNPIRIWHDTFIDNKLFSSIEKGETYTFNQIIGDDDA